MFRSLRNSSSLQNQRKTYKLANGLLQLSGMFIEKFENFKAPSGINPLPARSPVFSLFLKNNAAVERIAGKRRTLDLKFS